MLRPLPAVPLPEPVAALSDGAGPVRSCFGVSTNFEMPKRGTDPYLDDDSHFPMSEADVKEELRAADRATAKIAASC